MIFKVQTFPNLPGKQFRTTMVQEIDENRFRRRLGSWGALFSVWVAFLSILGSYLAPRLASLDRLSADFRDFLADFGAPCGFSFFNGTRGDGWDRFWVSRGPSRYGFWKVLGYSLRCFGHSFFPSFLPTSSQVCPNSRSVVVLPSVSHRSRPALQLQGRWSRGAC